MTNKAYIVANEQQEREVLENFEREGFIWKGGLKPTKFIPKKRGKYRAVFPYALINEGVVRWCNINQLEDEEIVYDGRKEEQMSEKYVVSQKFMNELKEWRDNNNLINNFIGYVDLGHVPVVVTEWWKADMANTPQTNNRLIAIIRWVNGEDVFEVEKQKKWVVHELNTELYVTTYDGHTGITPNRDYITKFDTKEEAESWANSHQEVIEVVDV